MTFLNALIILGITTILGAIGWVISKSLSIYKDLTDSINRLNLSITGVNGVLLSMQQGNDSLIKTCDERHDVVETRLNEHAHRLNEHDKKIVELVTIVKLT